MLNDRDLPGATAAREAEGRSEPKAAPTTEREGLTVEQILAWADAQHAADSVWPAVGPGMVSGMVSGVPGESWKAINHALALGERGLPGDSSLAELLAEHRGVPLPDMGPRAQADKAWEWEQEQFPIKGPRLRLRNRPRHPGKLTIDEILAWADAHHAATGTWPGLKSGPVRDAPYDITWINISQSLEKGRRGLPGGSTLRLLLTEHRDVKAPLSIERILAWADAFHAAHGRWPANRDGTKAAAPGETWAAIEQALRAGRRGLPGGCSMSRLLIEHRGPETRPRPPRLTVDQILAWADTHFAATGSWPKETSGIVAAAPTETWSKIELALRQQHRGLKGKTSLARLLAIHRGVRNQRDLPRLTTGKILAWADAHHAATGRWPTKQSGPVTAAPGENWHAIQTSLYHGLRGLPGGGTLALLLADRKPAKKPPLTLETIRTWAEGHFQATGFWPDLGAGPVAGVPGEYWNYLDRCLRVGRRGLPGGMTLHQLLGPHLDRVSRHRLPQVTVEQILAWADAFHAAHGRWPTEYSGPIPGTNGLRWKEINSRLRSGARGLRRGMSVKKLLDQHRGAKR